MAAARHPTPSRLAFIVELRQAQQDAEVRMPELLKARCADHPESAPQISAGHTWQVTYLPRFAYRDELVHPLMRHFEQQRLALAALLERWAWLSPSMAPLQVSHYLAGITAALHTVFLDVVDQYEQPCRNFFVPRVMSYRGLTADDYAHIPRFQGVAPVSGQASAGDRYAFGGAGWDPAAHWALLAAWLVVAGTLRWRLRPPHG